MAYVRPQVSVFQDFTVASSPATRTMNALIAGGHAKLIRFADEDERENGYLGYYDNEVDIAYDWPNRPAGGDVDESYTKLYAVNGLLRYFHDVSNFTYASHNQLVTTSDGLVEYDGYARDALLLRDVKVGDPVKHVDLDAGSSAEESWSYVKSIEREEIASSVTSSVTGPSSHPGEVGSAVTQTRGPWNEITAADTSGGTYNVYPTGQLEETYTIIVTQSSVDGDLTTARLRIISASGLDDVDDVQPGAAGDPTNIGTLGGEVTFDVTPSSAASLSAYDAGYSPIDLIAGQRWTVTFIGTYTASIQTAAGTYDGPLGTDSADTLSYIVEVIEGSKFADGPIRVTARSSDGKDFSGPTTVSGTGEAFAVGTRGVTMTFATGDGGYKGARFTVTVHKAYPGKATTIVLADSHGSTVGNNAEVWLYIRKSEIEITQNRIGYAPTTNFDTTDTQITVNAGIIGYDEEWVDAGVPQPLPLESSAAKEWGKLYVEYRAWLSDLSGEIGAIDDVGNIDTLISGSLHPDNPLKWGVFKALENSNGVAVKYIAVENPTDVDAWTDTLEKLVGSDEVYGLVPLTRDRTVQDLFATHVNTESSAENGQWRVAWFNLQSFPTVPVVSAGAADVPGYTAATTTDGNDMNVTFSDDPDTAGTQYTIVVDDTINGAFITNGVRAGDILRVNYTSDGFGDYTYEEYVVDEILSETRLRLLTGPDSNAGPAVKAEIWRNLTATEEAAAVASDAGSWGNRRIRAVWPDEIESSGTVQEGYFLCCSLAGLASGILPHQGMTNLEITGYSDVSRTTDKFNRAQLNTMAEAGVWIVTQDPSSGNIYTRHAVTTGSYDDLNQREEQITRNVDAISYRFADYFAPYIGVTNVTDSMIELLRVEVTRLVEVLKYENYTDVLGGQLVSATITDLRQHATLRDHIVMFLDVVLPVPFNNFAITLVV